MAANPVIVPINVNTMATNVVVPVLRKPKLLAYIYALLTGTTTTQNDIATNYLGGLIYIAWGQSVNYALNDRISYGSAQYECIQANYSTLLNSPSNPLFWYKICSDNIGVNERLNYNCSLMQLEYALNKRFNSATSILPPYNSGVGNIYITTNANLPRIAYRGRNNAVSSWVAAQSATSFYFHTKGNPTLTGNNYTIYVPAVILSYYSDLIIINETNKYNAVGLTFNIISY